MKKKKNIRSTLPYDANGNLFSDFNKGLATIKYNILNLPDTVQHVNGHLLSNSYDATGDKFLAIHRTMTGSGVSMQAGWTYYNYPTGYTIGSSTSRMYLDNSEYFSYNLDKILTDDGILVRTNDYSATTPVMGTNYFIRDHLGNVRVVFGDSGLIRQVNNYYPFGMEYGESAQTLSELNYQNYLYGGKELDRKFGINAYDFTGRYYDLTDNRFWSMDPMAEKYYSISPYAYCANNPLRFIDPTGRAVIAADPNAIRNIINTLNKSESQYIRFDRKGLLDVSLLSQSNSTSENFTALSTLANSEINYIFAVSDRDVNGSEFFEKGSDANNPNNFSYGVTNLPGAENDPSPDNNVYIYTASFLDEKIQARNTAHEGYGHAYFFELKKSDESINPSHTKGVVGTGSEYDSYTKKNVPYFIFGNTNKKLEEQIKKVEQQAIENYEEKKP